MPDTAAEITIRKACAADAAFVVALGARAFAIYAHDARASTRGMLAHRATEAGVAEVDGVPIGFVLVDVTALGRPFGPWARPAIARIDAIAVDSAWRTRGVGRKLLVWAEANARARGACVLSLNTATQNAPARRLFRAYGFEPLARIGRIYAGGRAAVAMSKPLL